MAAKWSNTAEIMVPYDLRDWQIVPYLKPNCRTDNTIFDVFMGLIIVPYQPTKSSYPIVPNLNVLIVVTCKPTIFSKLLMLVRKRHIGLQLFNFIVLCVT